MFIAILEDDVEVGAIMERWLRDADHEVAVFVSGAQLLAYKAIREIDVFLLDWVLPGMTGFEVLKLLKTQLYVVAPVLFITIRDAEIDVVSALDAGADDYLVKPVRHHELLARINAVTRRLTDGLIGTNEEVFGAFRFDPSGRQVYCYEEMVELTLKEFELALFLFKNAGKLISRDVIANVVWGGPVSELSRTIDTHVSRIRKKLDIAPENGYRLQPVYNAGYRLERVQAGQINAT
ncbi:MAG: response regulator transcription factor [Betaproteobacteria bacterium]